MSDKNVNTWADGFGRWHVSVPLSDSEEADASKARDLIVTELAQREGPNFDPRAVQVTREQVTSHGTAIYGEVENPAFDVSAWLDTVNLTGVSREQARNGVKAGYQWASENDLGTATETEEAAYSAGEGHFQTGFDQGKEVYESDEYPGGLENY